MPVFNEVESGSSEVGGVAFEAWSEEARVTAQEEIQ